MRDIELLFKKFLAESVSSEICQQDDVYMLEGCRQLYEAAGDRTYKDFLLQRIEKTVDHEGSISINKQESENCKFESAGAGRLLFWVHSYSGEEKYQKAIEKQIALVKNQYQDVSTPQKTDGRTLYLTQPFYMEYETKCHNKAEYKDIVKLLAGAFDIDQIGVETDKISEDALEDIGWYLMALTDVIGCMSMEIYEHYRFLEEKLKRTIRLFTSSADSLPGSGKSDFCIMMGYVILKACNQKNLNAEKYGSIGGGLVENAVSSWNPTDSKKTVGLLMMAYAQLLLFRGHMQPV